MFNGGIDMSTISVTKYEQVIHKSEAKETSSNIKMEAIEK